MGKEEKPKLEEILKKLDVLASQTNAAFHQVNDRIKRLEQMQGQNTYVPI